MALHTFLSFFFLLTSFSRVTLAQVAGLNASELNKVSTFAQMSMAATGDPRSCESAIPSLKVITNFTSPLGQEGYFAVIPDLKTVAIVFAGTTNFQNALSDIDVVAVPLSFAPQCDDCWGHAGAVANYLDVKKATDDFAAAKDALQAGYTFTIVGYSLGAAVASIAAIDMADVATGGVFTYGEFRATTEAAATYLNQQYGDKYFRVIQNKDIVPSIIPALVYVHHGISYLLEGDTIDTLQACSGQDDPKCQGGLSVQDHLLYIAPADSCQPATSRKLVKRRKLSRAD